MTDSLRLSATSSWACKPPETERGCTEPETVGNLHHGHANRLRRPAIFVSCVDKKCRQPEQCRQPELLFRHVLNFGVTWKGVSAVGVWGCIGARVLGHVEKSSCDLATAGKVSQSLGSSDQQASVNAASLFRNSTHGSPLCGPPCCSA